ncbi:hypothetical protein BJV38_002878 [Clostridium beijerinckii]|uniref:hypothetical protein n=1 Tax=Clostridium beijerinckii TaxID=1520 RepID=UPI0015706BCC|nr:hypothetical protein [Clostridium beijerinckii]NRT34535.1 hypothetical protein [Clostridium beijerinckii]NRT46035.1 hypothetical protein [Clostridium beijerinckii]NRZ19963.1 hypothetical protein [Clostridium beijerinckii]
MAGFSGIDRIEILGMEIIALISQGKKETLSKIKDEINNGDVARYIGKKYEPYMTNILIDGKTPYNLDEWKKEFNKFAGVFDDRESRKFGIVNEDDGLLLILGIILEMLQSKNY